MKLIHLKKLKRECVLVELANTESHPRIIPAMGNRRIFYSDQYGLDGLSSIELDFQVKLLGHFPSLKEQDFEGLVHTDEIYDPVRFPWGEGIAYKNYAKNTWGWSARESFLSYLESEGWYVNGNPYQNDWDELCKYGHGGFAKDGKSEYEIYIEAQEKVIDLSSCYLFVKS